MMGDNEMDNLYYQSPNFLAPGTGFMEDNVSTNGGGGLVQAVM